MIWQWEANQPLLNRYGAKTQSFANQPFSASPLYLCPSALKNPRTPRHGAFAVKHALNVTQQFEYPTVTQ